MSMCSVRSGQVGTLSFLCCDTQCLLTVAQPELLNTIGCVTVFSDSTCASFDKEEKTKITPFSVDLVRSLVTHQAAQPLCLL